MRWRKLGLVVPPGGAAPWARTHAAVPVCLPLDDRQLSIVYCARDDLQRSRPARAVVDLSSLAVLKRSAQPLMDLGPAGTFDDSGNMPTWAVTIAGTPLIYYIGWNRAVTVPFQNAIGVAHYDPASGAMTRLFDGPIVARSRRDPYFVASCAVLPFKGGWRMWYLSCNGWITRDGELTHRYNIKQMDSKDGVDWNGPATTAIDFADAGEYAISRPSILVENGVYHMWYSHRGGSYRIGYARSDDGENWVRRDDLVGIGVSESGWDSEMVCYPHVFEMNGRRYMAYNGNGYGATGIGLAVLESELK